VLVIAALRTGIYNVFLLLHIVAIIAAFAPAVINPVMSARYKKDGEGPLRRFAEHSAANAKQIHLPALIATGFFGLGMVMTSKTNGHQVWSFGDAWVSLGLLVWLAIIGVIVGMILPNEKKLAAGQLDAEKTIAIGGQVATVLLLVMLYLMIWKPGA
jgi:uncharacterized membrane protein